jgi:hypothetical protein
MFEAFEAAFLAGHAPAVAQSIEMGELRCRNSGSSYPICHDLFGHRRVGIRAATSPNSRRIATTGTPATSPTGTPAAPVSSRST